MTLPALLDTNIVSMIMRGEPGVRMQAEDYIREHGRLAFSSMTRFEVLRGLLVHRSGRRRAVFEQLCRECDVILLAPEIIDRAAAVYAHLHRRGHLIGDADILIGATALVEGRRLITDNVRHLERIPDLVVENWLASA